MSAPGPTRRPPLRLLIAGGIVLTGAVWILQGLGILTAAESFMVGDPTWTVIGAAFVLLGAVYGGRSWRR